MGVLFAFVCLISASLFPLQVSALKQPESFEPWMTLQSAQSDIDLLANIVQSGPAQGIVLASPSRWPDYRAHWVRDGALVMNYVFTNYMSKIDHSQRPQLLNILYNYVDRSREQQLTQNPVGGPGDLGLGEVKFDEHNQVITTGWPRPQNDGPALRASTLIRLANELLTYHASGNYVITKLYDGKIPTNSVLKADLEYTAHHWRDPSYDLWEEVLGDHYYTRLAQRKALMDGARLADKLADSGAADYYRQQAQIIKSEMFNSDGSFKFWDVEKGHIVATINQVGGHHDKIGNLDIAIVLATLHSPQEDGFMSFTDERVLATVAKLHDSFGEEYQINKTYTHDAEGELMGHAHGRYPGDKFDGYSVTSRGNPWILSTSAIAEFSYRARKEWLAKGRIEITAINKHYFEIFMPSLNAQIGTTIDASSPQFSSSLNELKKSGDRFLRRVKFHTGPDRALWEQWDRITGFMTSARNLTWSCAAFLTAKLQRE